ncbi:MAG: TlpA disulfide reductase family protein [Alphaproteobacteria bacterium]
MVVLAVIVVLAPNGTLAHGRDHPRDIRSARSQFVHFKPLRTAAAVPILAPDGRVHDLSFFRGKVVLLNFWATWCAPCIEELPALDRLQERLGDDAFEIVAPSIDEDDIAVPASFVTRLGLKDLNVYQDSTGEAQNAFPLYGLPVSYLIDHEGLVLGYVVGVVKWDSRTAVKFLRHYLP